jgi:hypothetical protein
VVGPVEDFDDVAAFGGVELGGGVGGVEHWYCLTV